jgi:DNA-binding LacI/PurR family transcriptional regulator/transposase-like protein
LKYCKNNGIYSHLAVNYGTLSTAKLSGDQGGSGPRDEHPMQACPHCGSDENQVRAGRSGDRQRYKCGACLRRYLTDPRPRGHAETVRLQALALHAQGVGVGLISRQLGVTGQSVRNWVRTAAQPAPSEPTILPEMAVASTAKRRPTITDVARQAGVSRSTVSNILNGKGRMGEATRARVHAAMEDLHFTPSALIRAIHRQRTRILGVLIFGLTRIAGGPAPALLSGIATAAEAAGYNMLLYTGWERGAGRHAALEFLDGHIDGLIWVAPAMQEPALERLAEAGLPTVALLSRHAPDGIGYVNADNIGAVQGTVAHLYELGHRRIAYLGSDHDSNFQDRLAGYRSGLGAVGLGHDARLEVIAERSLESTRGALSAWLALASPPTAVIIPNDGWAGEFGAAALDAGLRIPEDISVTGFDDSPAAPAILGGLTTVGQPFQQMGQLAGESLLALIEGASAIDCRLTIPCGLVIRTSTATPGHGSMG